MTTERLHAEKIAEIARNSETPGADVLKYLDTQIQDITQLIEHEEEEMAGRKLVEELDMLVSIRNAII